MNENPEIVGVNRLLVEGFVYVKSRSDGNRTYWDCYKVRRGECKGRATTVSTGGSNFVITKGPRQSQHTHPPNREFAEAEKIKANLKRKAHDQLDRPPSGILQTELDGLSSAVISQLPERENLKKSIRVVRRKNLPKSPTSLEELGDLPAIFTKTSTGDNFLIYDSKNDEDYEPKDRIIVFATRRNLELLSSSSIWFLDGTFKVC